jgi:NTP pyrophosphatase (non-canonical NTP hydrolase)
MNSTKLEDIVKFQKEFDDRHGWVRGEEDSEEEFLKNLQYSVIGLAGETGELANFAKKILREKHSNGKYDPVHLESMKEELVDVFIYLVILSIVLKMDIGKKYYEKMEFNKKRFEKFKKK